MQIRSDERVEFYAPFAHIPNRYEVCRIHAEGYGSFDVLILITDGTDCPVTVYVNSETGSRFMDERYPESTCIRLPTSALRIHAPDGASEVSFEMEAESGPIRTAKLRFEAEDAEPEAAEYGGYEFPVWGSGHYCRGVDLNVPARVSGRVAMADGSVEEVDEGGIVTLGSVGIIGRRG